MDAIELLLTRRSYKPAAMREPGPDNDELSLILTAALRTPDHGRLSPWRIQVIDGPGRNALADLLERIHRAERPDANADSIAVERARATRSPLLLVVSSRLRREGRIPVLEQLLSGGAVCQNLLNAVHASGFVAQWVTGWPAYHPEVKAALRIPEDDHILGWIYVGSSTEAPLERQRASIDDVVERWVGQRSDDGPTALSGESSR